MKVIIWTSYGVSDVYLVDSINQVYRLFYEVKDTLVDFDIDEDLSRIVASADEAFKKGNSRGLMTYLFMLAEFGYGHESFERFEVREVIE